MKKSTQIWLYGLAIYFFAGVITVVQEHSFIASLGLTFLLAMWAVFVAEKLSGEL